MGRLLRNLLQLLLGAGQALLQVADVGVRLDHLRGKATLHGLHLTVGLGELAVERSLKVFEPRPTTQLETLLCDGVPAALVPELLLESCNLIGQIDVRLLDGWIPIVGIVALQLGVEDLILALRRSTLRGGKLGLHRASCGPELGSLMLGPVN